MKYYILLGSFLLMQADGMYAKEQVKVAADGTSVSRSGDSVRVSFKLNVSGLKKEYILGITPVLYGSGGMQETLPAIRYGSRTAQIQAWRDTGNRSATYYKEGEEMLYTHTLLYREWMGSVGLRLEAVNRGCCDERTLAPLALAENVVLATPAERFAPELAQPEPVVPVADKLAEKNSFLEAWKGSIGDKEDITRYREEATLVVYFPVGRAEILPDFENNEERLNHLLDVLNKIAQAKDSKVAKILVVGSASPEGPARLNERIAGKRAQVLIDYITERTTLDTSFFEKNNEREDWHILRKLVAESELSEKQAIIDIIDTAPVWDAKKKVGRLTLLMRLNQGKPYRYMEKHFFPKLRNAGYIKVFYESQPDPQLVALNRATELLKAKDYARVLEVLEGNTHYRADNLRGVCCVMTGDIEQAHDLFNRGAAAGDRDALKNRRQLEELIKPEIISGSAL